MSSNFFAALDDSGDEAPTPKKPVVAAAPKETKDTKPKAKKVVVEPSKVDDAKRPNANDRNTKFGRGGRAPPRDGKRAYERRSGTGRGKEIKKGGGGARNWGSDKNEARQAAGHLEEKDGTTEPAPEASEKGEEPEEAEDVAEEEVEEPATPPVEDKTLSYEEYLEQKKQQQAESAIFAPVKERQVENAFANAKPKEAVEEDFLVMGGGKEKKPKAKTKEILTVPTGFRVEPNASNSDRLGGERGGRGRGRGRGGGRGGDGESSGRGGGRFEGRGGGRFEGRGGGRFEGRGGGRGEGRGGGRGGGRGEGRGEGRGDGRGGPRGSGRGGGGRTEGVGRGRGAGSRGGGGGLNVNDTQAFPSL